ncbi:LysR family transcriptional regulator [Pandoraea anhela]|uniref:LysR family transcriptional regulator n=1 Tax=Pandoraea anhela TaxID=2508295 RepID=A0A5E4ZAP4_9BURK|nr:LysR family transcriptional regulator [Pandoraea anhela]VVE57672.1 LysR family transcriptional regulator [Pandoraea anhela]
MFETVLLRSFATVVQEGSFTQAAVRLNLTQSAVSAHLRRLEQQVGHDLLARTTRSVTLTADGETLLGYARAILALNREARAQLLRGPKAGTVRIGVSEDLANVRLMNVMQAFAARHPRVAFSIRVGIPGDLLQSMDDNDIDIVVGGRCQDVQPARVLWREPLIWAGADWMSISPNLPVPVALHPEPCPYREAALTALAKAEVDYRIVMVCPSGTGLSAAAQAGFAFAPMAHSLLSHGLRVISPDEGLPALPDVEFTLFSAPGPSEEVADQLGDAIALAFGHQA